MATNEKEVGDDLYAEYERWRIELIGHLVLAPFAVTGQILTRLANLAGPAPADAWQSSPLMQALSTAHPCRRRTDMPRPTADRP